MSSKSAADLVPARDASTVILIRDGRSRPEIEVFLLERVGGMAFAGGMTVFPGGGVDLSDAAADVRWAGPPPSWWAERFGTDEGKAQALVCAAARETFEECGVLLAGSTPDSVVADTSPFAAERGRLERRELSFAEFLTAHDLVLRSDLLRPWSHWITPVGEARRYDTRFFVAVLPEGQNADGETSEAASVSWRSTGEALADWRSGHTILLPPTWSQLDALSRFDTVAEVVADEREITPVLPVLTREDGTVRVFFDGDEAYYAGTRHPWSDRRHDAR
ncbi:NUDIX hydrolase [Rhodococcus sp. ARC_M12]|uniref:NUDIX hydrolase n=1 Tax=unclassified Rhodococcus (in: high G+C Gram-positive bacteria) TaxID=192944 RepID=UPI001FB1DAA1|nr:MULTISPECIES: NUDIX hydrolase [unclassified Rhodococcus (in: high G+C Gram-positive bacteria)]MCJ0890454.1 NUDIX hydrolase [Rhodococcus sp. ARC_M5]MCJ0976604.1 NUDIX hydrolase [Rhodococcus sp. ARC_M12]